MSRYIEAIRQLETERNALIAEIHRTVRVRHESPQKFADWKRATRQFHESKSDLTPLIMRCWRASDAGVDPELRNFMFDYIAADPYFFRSGYLMERVLQRVKQLALTPGEKEGIADLLLSRIRSKALRNFRRICRLIPLIDTAELRESVETLAQSDDPAIRRRAEFALAYFPK